MAKRSMEQNSHLRKADEGQRDLVISEKFSSNLNFSEKNTDLDSFCSVDNDWN